MEPDRPDATTETLRFGVFELDPSSGELRKQGVRIKLQAQPLQLLVLLLEHPGSIISREQIRQVLWPADTFVDFDRSLNTAIKKVREALGDAAHAPRYIETIPRRGYRFLAPVERPGTQVQTSGRARRLWLAIAACGMVVVSVALVSRTPRIGEGSLGVQPRPLTSYLGSEWQVAFSPDGGQFAFTWNGPDEINFDIYVQAVGAAQPLRLTNNPAPDLSPAWSPHGDQIAFLRSHRDGASLLLAPASGGPEREVTRIHSAVVHYGPAYLAWMPDGRSFVYPDRLGAGKPDALFLWSLDTGQTRQVTFPPAGTLGDRFPSVSSDGRFLLFSRGSGADARLHRTNLTSPGEQAEVAVGGPETRSGIWTGNGKAILATAGVQHWSGLWLMRAEDGSAPLQVATYPAISPASSRSGRRVAYTMMNWDANIWQLTTPRGGAVASPLIASSYLDHLPDLSPDGERIAFVSSRSGAQELYVCDRRGGGLLKLTSLGTSVGAPQWSPKGDRIAFSAQKESGRNEIHVIDANGSGAAQLTAHPADDFTPSWSLDGDWIYFASNRAGTYDIWRMRASGAEPQRITHGGGVRPIQSPDGRYLYYALDRFETAVWRTPADGGREEMVLPSLSNWANFAVSGERIIFIPGVNAALLSTIQSFNPATGEKEVLMHLKRRPVWGLTAQAGTVLFSQADRDSSDLMIIDPFPAR